MKHFKLISIYIIGILFWFILFAALKANCIVNVFGYIDNLWTKPINKNLVRSLSGAIAVKTEINSCQDWLIYNAVYSPNDIDKSDTTKHLTSIIDIDSWSLTEIKPPTMTYEDKHYRYVIYNNSDGVYMRIFDK